MKKALIGHKGFVGSNLKAKGDFNFFFDRSNISSATDDEFDLVVCAAPSAAVWLANQNPEDDLAQVDMLIDNLRNIRTKKFVQISTVNVYNDYTGPDEDTAIDPDRLDPYGKHRFHLESFIQQNFEDSLVLHLPGLFGDGLKKNLIYDLIKTGESTWTHKDSTYQYYYLPNLWHDIEIALENNIHLLNITSEPASAKEIAKECFNIDFDNITEKAAVHYDMRSKYTSLYDGKDGYLYSKNQIFGMLKEFIKKGIV